LMLPKSSTRFLLPCESARVLIFTVILLQDVTQQALNEADNLKFSRDRQFPKKSPEELNRDITKSIKQLEHQEATYVFLFLFFTLFWFSRR